MPANLIKIVLYLIMNRSAPLIFSLILNFLVNSGIAQQHPVITKPILSLEETVLELQYEIINSPSSDRFIIGVDVTDSYGNKITPKTVSGDIGDDVVG